MKSKQKLPLVLSELLSHAKKVWSKPAPKWMDLEPTTEELRYMGKEAFAAGPFDRVNLKRGVWDAWKAGRAELICRELEGGVARVIALVPRGEEPPNWEVWGRVFQWMGTSGAATSGAATSGAATSGAAEPWRVYLFAAGKDRRFPFPGHDLGPEHVNGGYTWPCSKKGIVIYRSEEATRVLIHELLHAACLDEAEWPVEAREAAIEVWAELFMVAFVARGVVTAAVDLWDAQSHWVSNTNWRARHRHFVEDSSDYGWRYLCGREDMYRRLGVALPAPQPAAAAGIQSLRFTHPRLEI